MSVLVCNMQLREPQGLSLENMWIFAIGYKGG